jgi:hypothetical protein
MPIFLAAGQVSGSSIIITAKKIQLLLLIKIYTIQIKNTNTAKDKIAW